jgi:two-component sensor histidine kinase
MSEQHLSMEETASFAKREGSSRGFAVRVRTPEPSKDISVEEAEHRARNLIQLAAGLLRAQAMRIRAPSAREALESASDRLVALAQAYARMEEPDADGQVNLGRQLRSLCRAWDSDGGGTHVSLSIDAQPLSAPAPSARAVALLANEAITNALKHAYPEMAGKVAVRLHRCAADRLRLSIEDGGKGLPSDAEEGFGFTLMRTLAEQLGGTFFVQSPDGHGTIISVEFPDLPSAMAPARQA